VRLKIAIASKRGLQSVGCNLAGRARQIAEFQAAAKKFRRAALVGRNVRFGMTEYDAPGRRDLRERQRICRRAGRYQEHRDVALEDFAKTPFDASRSIVIAIAERKAAVRPHNGVKDFGRDRRRVVAGKIHANRRFMNLLAELSRLVDANISERAAWRRRLTIPRRSRFRPAFCKSAKPCA